MRATLVIRLLLGQICCWLGFHASGPGLGPMKEWRETTICYRPLCSPGQRAKDKAALERIQRLHRHQEI